MTSTATDVLTDFDTVLDTPALVVVWDDPVNTFNYVTMVFRKVFGWPVDECRRKMLEVHNDGRSVVFSGTRSEAETIATAIRSYQLWASVET
jgi:ATP-dependent Clp protease adaptor protein ClpS